jgi:hypothetical protein
MRRDLRRHREIEAAAVAEVDQRARQPIGAEAGVAIDERDAALGLRLEEKTSRDDRIAADVVETAAADVRLVADVGGVEVVVAEEHLDRAQRADPPVADERAGAQPLRMEAHHERLGDQCLADGRASATLRRRSTRSAFRTARACLRPLRRA